MSSHAFGDRRSLERAIEKTDTMEEDLLNWRDNLVWPRIEREEPPADVPEPAADEDDPSGPPEENQLNDSRCSVEPKRNRISSAPFALKQGRTNPNKELGSVAEHQRRDSLKEMVTYGGFRYNRSGTLQQHAEKVMDQDFPLPDGAIWIANSNRRLHADQQGWRSDIEQQQSRNESLRKWVRLTAIDGSGEEDIDPAAPDIVHGLWTCCKMFDPKSPGCVQTWHSNAEAKCGQCGGWCPREKWFNEGCRHHKMEAWPHRFHGCQWPCCGMVGWSHSKWSDRPAEQWQARRELSMSTQAFEEHTAMMSKGIPSTFVQATALPHRTAPHRIEPSLTTLTVPYLSALCRAVPCHAVLSHAISCCAVPWHDMSCRALPCHAVPCHAML